MFVQRLESQVFGSNTTKGSKKDGQKKLPMSERDERQF
jgi:hypothetical protein